tara:strand:+ start:3367 stop:3537 length:171 start_codon:yes stop_codon:yes gene_type:complete
MVTHESHVFKRDPKEIPKTRRLGALPDSMQQHLSKERLGNKTSTDIENKIYNIKEI